MMILDKAFASKKGVSRYFMNEFKIVKFVDNSFEIDVRADINNETVWLTQKEMALLFEVSIDNIRLFECFYDVNVQTGCLLLLKVLNLLKQKKSASLMQYFCSLIIYRIK